MSNSLTLTLHGRSSSIKTYFTPEIILDGNWELALLSFQITNSIPNITKPVNVIFDKRVITIPKGAYEIENIERIIKSHLHSYETFSLKGNRNTLRAELLSNQMVTLPTEITKLLGFKKESFNPEILYISERVANVAPLETIRINVNIANGAFLNNQQQSVQTHCIHEIFIDVEPGYKILDKVNSLIYYPVNTSRLNEIQVDLVDEKGRPVLTQDQPVTIRLHLQKV